MWTFNVLERINFDPHIVHTKGLWSEVQSPGLLFPCVNAVMVDVVAQRGEGFAAVVADIGPFPGVGPHVYHVPGSFVENFAATLCFADILLCVLKLGGEVMRGKCKIHAT